MLELPDDVNDLDDQIGSGSLIIDLEVDIREELGWVEEVSLMPNFTLHTASKPGQRLSLIVRRREDTLPL